MNKLIKYFDAFSKEIRLYYNKEEKYNSPYSLILTLIYFFLSFGIFAFYLNSLISRKKLTTNDSIISPNIMEEINMTSDLFNFAIALENITTFDEYIDETIYQPKAFYTKRYRKGNEWITNEEQIELEPCNINKFGKKFQHIFNNKPLHNMYCLKNISYLLSGHPKYDYWSSINIQFYPCNIHLEGNKCKPKSVIESQLLGTFVSIQTQNIALNPENYSYPIQESNEDITTSLGAKYFRDYTIFLRVVEIQTDIGFLFEKINKVKVIQIDRERDSFYMLNESEFFSGGSFARISFRLSEKKQIQKRNYLKAFEMFSYIGGFIQLLKTFLLICTLMPKYSFFYKDILKDLFKFNYHNINKEVELKHLKIIKKISDDRMNKKIGKMNLSLYNEAYQKEKMKREMGIKTINKVSNNNNINNDEDKNCPSHINFIKNYISYNIISNKNVKKFSSEKEEKNVKVGAWRTFCIFFCNKHYDKIDVSYIKNTINYFKERLDIINLFKHIEITKQLLLYAFNQDDDNNAEIEGDLIQRFNINSHISRKKI